MPDDKDQPQPSSPETPGSPTASEIHLKILSIAHNNLVDVSQLQDKLIDGTLSGANANVLETWARDLKTRKNLQTALDTSASVLDPDDPFLTRPGLTMTWLGVGDEYAGAVQAVSAATSNTLIESDTAIGRARDFLFRPRPNVALKTFTPDHHMVSKAWVHTAFPDLILALIQRSYDGENWKPDLAWLLTPQTDK